MKEKKYLTLKLYQKKKKNLIKLNTRNINKKLNRKDNLKSENKELRYKLVQNLENLKEQATRLQKCIGVGP